MCGITGIVSVNSNNVSQSRLKGMTDIIAHRGPDGDGHWISGNGNVGLGHRRLSIIDLSHEADQPMHYMNRYHLVFNGEIYNYLELKDTLQKQGYTFTTASDTEVLLALYDRDKENCLQWIDGMFAFVIYDDKENEVFAARDRFGEKPFFYNYIPGKHFLFGSEMKCLWEAGVEKNVNNRMLYNYLTLGYLDNPIDLSETFYENCTRLPHSHYIKLSIKDCKLTIKQYYDIDWRNADHSITVDQAKEKFHELFYTSVQRRLRSDVTVGSSLSGGLDSSLVVAVIDNLKKGTGQRQDTFSAVFPGFKKDERKYMDHVIAATHVNPHFVTPTDEGLIGAIDKLNWHQEEPYGSASIYVQYCVMQLAKENNVTVLLDGQGADEILAGYHAFYPPYFASLKKQDTGLYKKELAAYGALHGNSEINADVRKGLVSKIKLFAGRQAPAFRKMYHHYKQLKDPVLDPEFYNTYRKSSFESTPVFENLNHALYHSTFKQGLQELLRYADRNSMAHSREVRLPFLSHELVEFLLTLPPGMKIKEGWTKWIMRQTFQRELPPEIGWRKDKIGYEPPQQNWLQRDEVKKKMEAAQNKLVDKHILKRTAKEQGKGDKWRFWMAGQMIK
ncbi:MAG: asparagine synthase (glutamine-hydrolyzing) [Ferruginibacter sp.]